MSSYLPFVLRHHEAPDASASGPDVSKQKLRSTRSLDSLIRPLSSLLQRPAAILDYVLEEIAPLPSAEAVAQQELDSRRELCSMRLRQATAFSEWQAAAAELDTLDGNDEWKYDPRSPDYDFELVQAKLQELDDARISQDPDRMLFLIRTSLTRYLGRMGNIKLYKHSHVGTKRLIERYIASALDTITALLDSTLRPGGLGCDPRHLLDQIVLARQSFGRCALLLSGGGTFGMNHIGVVKSLWESHLLPRIISGASAGSIVCSVLCTRTDEELPNVMEEFCYGDLDVFTKGIGDDSILKQASRLLKDGALFDIGNLIRVMKNLLGDMTFQEGYNRTRRILSICVSSAGLYELPRLLNYVTAPNVIIWSAVAASCSVPLVFQPAPLLAKDPQTGEAVPWNISPQSWIDGSVDNDLPMTRLAELFNVNHFIVSQVNPHVVPFLIKEDDSAVSAQSQRAAIRGTEPGWMYTLSGLAKDEIMHRMHVLSELGVFPTFMTKVRSIMSQRYSGDITILPEISYAEVLRVLKNPTVDFMLNASMCGERATWPKLSQIQNHCAIELALDDAVQQLRTRIAFSSSQVNLRSLTMNGMTAGAIAENNARQKDRSDRKRFRMSKQSQFDKARPSHEVRPNSSRARVRDEAGDRQNGHASKTSTRAAAEPPRKAPVSFQLTPQKPSSHDLLDDDESSDDENNIDNPSPLLAPRDLSPPTSRKLHPRFDSTTRLSSLSATSNPWKLFPHASQPATPLFSSSLPAVSAHSSYFPDQLTTLLAPQSPRSRTSPIGSPRLSRTSPRSSIPSTPLPGVSEGLYRSNSWNRGRASRRGSAAGLNTLSVPDVADDGRSNGHVRRSSGFM